MNFLIESGCKDIVPESHLLPLTGETFLLRSVNTSQEARLDIALRGVHNSMEKPTLTSECFTQVHYQTVSNCRGVMQKATRREEADIQC